MINTVGEPINEEAWQWYYNVVGEGRCPVVDTWWQTGKVLYSIDYRITISFYASGFWFVAVEQ